MTRIICHESTQNSTELTSELGGGMKKQNKKVCCKNHELLQLQPEFT